MMELCQGDPVKKKMVKSFRPMMFQKMYIKVRSYHPRFFQHMREEFHGEFNIDFIESFNIESNFQQIIKAC